MFNPQTVFEEESTEVGFTNRIEEHMKAFIIKQLAGDTNAIRKEVKLLIINVYILCIYIYMYIQAVSMYNVVKDNLKKKSIKKLSKDAKRGGGVDRN